ncbi:hypothetical protein OHR68_06470 [Spirillospora sp. NBC_00431]
MEATATQGRPTRASSITSVRRRETSAFHSRTGTADFWSATTTDRPTARGEHFLAFVGIAATRICYRRLTK